MVQEITGVRERLWLLAHDDQRDMRPHVDTRALGIGLVAAALSDLLRHTLITVRQGVIYPAPGRVDSLGGDPIASGILTAIRDDGTSRLADVLRGARADTAGTTFNPYLRVYERTQAALVATGTLVEHRRTLRPTQYLLADPHIAAWHRSQFNTRLVHHTGGADLATDSLCALIWALNLHRMLLMPYPPGEAQGILLDITERIPARAGPDTPAAVIPQLARSVRRAVGDLATATF